MDSYIITKTAASAIALLVIYLIVSVLKRYTKTTQEKFGIRKSRYFAIKRVISMTALVLSAIALLLIWNVSLNNLWISFTGILTLTAVAFFAVWSLAGNILAGLLIYFTSPFKIEDFIEIMPDEISGTVLAINTFYTVLLSTDNSYINVPNAMLFQRYIKVRKSSGSNNPTDQRGAE